MNDVEYQIECTTRDLATYLVRNFSFTVEQALRAVYNSELYQKLCAQDVGIDAVKLPSTSPANCAVSLEKLVEAYEAILE